MLSILPLFLGALAAAGCLLMASKYLRRKRLIDDLPTSKTQGVFIGLTEVKGAAESETPLTSYLAEIPCIQFAWRIEEKWSRTVTETYTDARGRTQTRTRTESGSTTVASGGRSAPFYLKDDTGVIRVLPDGAKIEGARVFNETCTPSNRLYFGKGPEKEVADSDHRRHFYETAIPLHNMLYVIGQARERQDVVAAEIASDTNAPVFVISTRTEKQISAAYGRWYWFWLVFGMVLSVAAIWIEGMVRGFSSPVGWQRYSVAGIAFMTAAGLAWVWTVYNNLVNLRQRVRQAWSQVDVELKRRNTLIPGLVQTVEGYRTYESEVQKLVAELRGQLAATPPGVAGPDFRGFAPTLRAIMERYPGLKAGESFLKLQQALADTEQRIALARDYFNEIATFYNIRLYIIPDRFVAALARLRPQPLMGAADFERAPVQVQLVS